MSIHVQGERWFPLENSFQSEMKDLWGDWYCDSEVGKLRSVLLHRPSTELEQVNVTNFHEFRLRGAIDLHKAQQQQDQLAAIYKEHGIEVHYVQGQRSDRPNAMYVRDLVLMTPEGAIICRPGIPARRGEEKAVAQTLSQVGVPIIRTINGNGYFEGACAMWLNRQTVILGKGSRSNTKGVEQVEFELKNLGVENIIHTDIPYGSIHLDGYMNMVDTNKMMIFPWHVTYDCARQLMELGIELIEVTNIEEIKQGMAMNGITLEPGKVLMPSGNPETKQLLTRNEIDVIEVDISEILKGWGGIHCMTAFLKRDPVPMK